MEKTKKKQPNVSQGRHKRCLALLDSDAPPQLKIEMSRIGYISSALERMDVGAKQDRPYADITGTLDNYPRRDLSKA